MFTRNAWLIISRSSKPAGYNHVRKQDTIIATWSLCIKHCTAWLIVAPMILVIISKIHVLEDKASGSNKGWHELLLHLNYSQFEHRPHGISSSLTSAEVLVCHSLNVCLKRDTGNSRPLHKMLTFYALIHLSFILQHLFYLFEY